MIFDNFSGIFGSAPKPASNTKVGINSGNMDDNNKEPVVKSLKRRRVDNSTAKDATKKDVTKREPQNVPSLGASGWFSGFGTLSAFRGQSAASEAKLTELQGRVEELERALEAKDQEIQALKKRLAAKDKKADDNKAQVERTVDEKLDDREIKEKKELSKNTKAKASVNENGNENKYEHENEVADSSVAGDKSALKSSSQ